MSRSRFTGAPTVKTHNPVESIQKAEEEDWNGVVIGNNAKQFSVGANLMNLGMMAIQKQFKPLEELVNNFQQIMMKIKTSKIPVVTATQGDVFGGGCEIAMHSDAGVYASESYIGLVEVGVGLIPGAGGNLRMLCNLSKKIKTGITGTLPLVQKAFETIGFAKVATSAKQAQAYGYLVPDDKIVINRDFILSEAKAAVLELSDNYKTPEVETFKLPGSAGRIAIDVQAKGMVKAGKISEHDALIGSKLAYVLTGGSKGGPFTAVDEQYLLDIEKLTYLDSEVKNISETTQWDFLM